MGLLNPIPTPPQKYTGELLPLKWFTGTSRDWTFTNSTNGANKRIIPSPRLQLAKLTFPTMKFGTHSAARPQVIESEAFCDGTYYMCTFDH